MSLRKPRGVVLNRPWEFRQRRWLPRLKSCATFAPGPLRKAALRMYLKRRATSWPIFSVDVSRIVPGWALYNQGKTEQAIEHLKLAAGIIPEGTPLWRTALWHLGAALDQMGNKTEALGLLYKKLQRRRSGSRHVAPVIEQLYQKINGSLDGLNERIGANQIAESNPLPPDAASIDKPAAHGNAISNRSRVPGCRVTRVFADASFRSQASLSKRLRRRFRQPVQSKRMHRRLRTPAEDRRLFNHPQLLPNRVHVRGFRKLLRR